MLNREFVVYLLTSIGTKPRMFLAFRIQEAGKLLIGGRDYTLLIQCCKDARVLFVY